MSLVELTEYIVKNIVRNKDDVSVKAYDSDDTTTIEVLVSSQDMGLVIGAKGRTINAIRTVVETSSYANNNNNKIIINVDTI